LNKTVLVGPDGRTLYVFEEDHGTTSACTGGCAPIWPALAVTAVPAAGPGVDASKLSMAHGQATYAGHLLYFYSGDHAPGDINGLRIPHWDAVSPTGAQVSARGD
jgi:predicted lipoprotein with Yx(FWY)xxD motif